MLKFFFQMHAALFLIASVGFQQLQVQFKRSYLSRWKEQEFTFLIHEK